MWQPQAVFCFLSCLIMVLPTLITAESDTFIPIVDPSERRSLTDINLYNKYNPSNLKYAPLLFGHNQNKGHVVSTSLQVNSPPNQVYSSYGPYIGGAAVRRQLPDSISGTYLSLSNLQFYQKNLLKHFKQIRGREIDTN